MRSLWKYAQVAKHQNKRVDVERHLGQPVSKGWNVNRGSRRPRNGGERGDPTNSLTSDQRLLVAIVERAWNDALISSDRPRRGRLYAPVDNSPRERAEAEATRDEARAWFLSEDDSPFTFVWCCLYLPSLRGLIPDIRARVLAAAPKPLVECKQLDLFPPYKKGTYEGH